MLSVVLEWIVGCVENRDAGPKKNNVEWICEATGQLICLKIQGSSRKRRSDKNGKVQVEESVIPVSAYGYRDFVWV